MFIIRNVLIEIIRRFLKLDVCEFMRNENKVQPHLFSEAGHVLGRTDDSGDLTTTTEHSRIFDPALELFVPRVFPKIIDDADHEFAGR